MQQVEQADSKGSWLLIGVIVALLILGRPLGLLISLATINVPSVGEVQIGSHAEERHGTEAQRARDAAQYGNDFGRYDCKDGRTRIVNRVGQREWAVVVLKGNIEITSFITTDQGYVRQMLENCEPQYRSTHP